MDYVSLCWRIVAGIFMMQDFLRKKDHNSQRNYAGNAGYFPFSHLIAFDFTISRRYLFYTF
jgi:hypothetical protein